jgi:hypothetical protein
MFFATIVAIVLMNGLALRDMHSTAVADYHIDRLARLLLRALLFSPPDISTYSGKKQPQGQAQ